MYKKVTKIIALSIVISLVGSVVVLAADTISDNLIILPDNEDEEETSEEKEEVKKDVGQDTVSDNANDDKASEIIPNEKIIIDNEMVNLTSFTDYKPDLIYNGKGYVYQGSITSSIIRTGMAYTGSGWVNTNGYGSTYAFDLRNYDGQPLYLSCSDSIDVWIGYVSPNSGSTPILEWDETHNFNQPLLIRPDDDWQELFFVYSTNSVKPDLSVYVEEKYLEEQSKDYSEKELEQIIEQLKEIDKKMIDKEKMAHIIESLDLIYDVDSKNFELLDVLVDKVDYKKDFETLIKEVESLHEDIKTVSNNEIEDDLGSSVPTDKDDPKKDEISSVSLNGIDTTELLAEQKKTNDLLMILVAVACMIFGLNFADIVRKVLLGGWFNK